MVTLYVVFGKCARRPVAFCRALQWSDPRCSLPLLPSLVSLSPRTSLPPFGHLLALRCPSFRPSCLLFRRAQTCDPPRSSKGHRDGNLTPAIPPVHPIHSTPSAFYPHRANRTPIFSVCCVSLVLFNPRVRTRGPLFAVGPVVLFLRRVPRVSYSPLGGVGLCAAPCGNLGPLSAHRVPAQNVHRSRVPTCLRTLTLLLPAIGDGDTHITQVRCTVARLPTYLLIISSHQ
ncbi:hypothetical protein OH77DRAFT_1248514 [Trametes cingulata]|nr:hypothetical protein OH77DRAFT_1248514 [Trametes cingulata]